MKTLFKFLFVAFTLTLISFSFAQADLYKPIGRHKKAAAFKAGIYTTSEGKIQIALHKETGGKVLVRLNNRAGTELFAQQIGKSKESARIRLDVSGLADGVYQVVITNGAETTIQELTLATQQPRSTPRLIALN